MLEPSSARTTPRCAHHGTGREDCGGCPWQFVSYEAQLEAKEERVRQALSRLQHPAEIAPIQGSPDVFGYRNRAQFKTDGRKLGYVAASSRQLAPIADCPILTPGNRATLQELLHSLPNKALRPGRNKDWTTLDIDEGIGAAEVVPNRRRPFRQGNSAQNLRMREWLAARVSELDPDRTVLELFSGSGNFTEVLVQAGFARIVAVEGRGGQRTGAGCPQAPWCGSTALQPVRRGRLRATAGAGAGCQHTGTGPAAGGVQAGRAAVDQKTPPAGCFLHFL